MGKDAIYQHLVLAVVTLIFSTVRVARGGFMCIRHNDLLDLTANMMSEVCKDTEIEPKLTPLSGGKLQGRTSKNSNEARIDIRT